MLPFFTDPYPNELIYSSISRYHFYNGNINFTSTLIDLFGKNFVFPTIEFGRHLDALKQNLGPSYSSEKIIHDHTIYPIYAPFINKERQQKAIKYMKEQGNLKSLLGMAYNEIEKDNKCVFFCERCVSEDIGRYGEPYLHREHHIQGINYCPHHEVKLHKYTIDYKMFSRLGFIRLDKRILDSLILEEDNNPIEFKKIEVQLSKMAFKLLEIPMHSLSSNVLFKKYRILLKNNNLIRGKSLVNRVKLLKIFNAKFPEGFLDKFNSNVDKAKHKDWLKRIFSDQYRQIIQPFRHLLLMYCFEQDIESLLNLEDTGEPFGKGPWPCLNIAAPHYKQLVISEVDVYKKANTDILIGRFNCSCGFKYTRRGPEKDENEKWIAGTVTSHGKVWESKLNELIALNRKPKDIAIELNVHVNCVRIKIFAKSISPQKTERCRLKLLELIKQNPHASREEFQKKYSKIFTYLLFNDTEWLDIHLSKKNADPLLRLNKRLEKYREIFLRDISENPSITRAGLRKKYGRPASDLYKYDREWYEGNMPSPVKNGHVEEGSWEMKDEEYYLKVKDCYPDLFNLEKPVRLTRGLFSRHLGIAVLTRTTELNISLPKTKALLEELTETIQEFKIRLGCLEIDKMLDKNGIVNWGKVRESCNMESKDFRIIKPYFEKYIIDKTERKEF